MDICEIDDANRILDAHNAATERARRRAAAAEEKH